MLLLVVTQIGSAVWIIATLRGRVIALENDTMHAWTLASRAHARIDNLVGIHNHRRWSDRPLPELQEGLHHEEK